MPAPARRAREQRQERVSAAKRRAQQHGRGGFTALNVPDGVQMLQVKKPGTFKWEIIPYTVGPNSKKFVKNYADPGELYFERTYFVYYGIGVNNGTYTSPSRTFGKKDPVAEFRQELEKREETDEAKAKALEKQIKALYGKERQLFLIWDRTNEAEAAKGVQLYENAYWNFGKLLDSRVNAADETDPNTAHIPYFYLPDEGSTLSVTFEEEQREGGTYLKATIIDFYQRKKPLPDDILQQAFCLDDVPREIEYNELRRIFLQIEDDASGGSHAEGNGAAKPRASKPVRDEDLDDDGVFGDEEADAAPPSKFRTAQEAGIAAGDLVTVNATGVQYEVGKISKDGTSLKLIDDEGEVLQKPFGVADVTKVDEEWGESAEPVAAEPEFDEDEEAPPPKPAGKKASSKAPPPPADDEGEWDDEPTPKAKPPKAAATKTKTPAAKAEGADEDDWD